MPRQLTKTLKFIMILLLPIIIIGGSARLLATDPYLAFEYGKASFPPDSYGLAAQSRFDLASTDIHYVRAHRPPDAFSNQTLEGGPVYTQREVAHMADVRSVFQAILRVWRAAFILLLLLGFVLLRTGEETALASAVRAGGLLTSAVILSIALLALFAWQFWFEIFHFFFFEAGTWLFSYSDMLIRLFPVEFWFDATITISILGLAGGSLLALIGWRGERVLAGKQAYGM